MAKSQRQSQRRAQEARRVASQATNNGGKPASATSTATRTTTSASSATSTATKTPSASSRLAEIRARTPQRAHQQQRKRYLTQPWWRRNLYPISTVVAVVILIVGFIVYANLANQKAAVGIGSAAPQSVLSALSGVSAQTAATVGSGGVQIGLESTPPNTPPLTKNGLPEIIYVGAEYCPYCAAERWSTVIALNRFGSFKGLTLMKSSSTDVFPNTNTLSFRNATYTSKYLVFSATETQDRDQKALGTPPAEALAAFTTYDTAPYTNQQGGIPFVSYANQYVTTEGPYQPTMLASLSWQQIAAQLNNPDSAATKAIVGTANVETAAICKVTDNKPAVCAESWVQTLEKTLPAR